MSKQRNRHKRHRPDGNVPSNEVKQDNNSISKDNNGNNLGNNHRAKSVVTTNVSKHPHNQDNQTRKGDNQPNNKSENNNNNDFNRRNRNGNQNKRNRNRNRRKKNKNNKLLKNVRPEDLFQLKDPKRARLLQNRKKKPRNFAPYKIEKAEGTICPICQKQINNMCDTLFDSQTNQVAHFECVYNRVSKSLNLKEGQRLAYIGSGNFAIIENASAPEDQHKNKFTIKEKIVHT